MKVGCEPRKGSHAKSECHHHCGNHAARLKAIQQPAHKRRADGDRDSRETEGLRNLFPVPAKRQLPRFDEEGEDGKENGGDASQNTNLADQYNSPARITQALFWIDLRTNRSRQWKLFLIFT